MRYLTALIHYTRHPKLFIKKVVDCCFAVSLYIRYKRGLIQSVDFSNYCWCHVRLAKRLMSKNEYMRLCDSIFNINIHRLKKRTTIRVCFVVTSDAAWGGDGLYKLFKNDNIFEVIIAVCKMNNLDISYDSVKDFYLRRGYKICEDVDYEMWMESDIFIYQNPYYLPCFDINVDRQSICKLCIMLPYAIFQGDSKVEHFENDAFFKSASLFWRIYCYTRYSYDYGTRNNTIGTLNMRLSGYPKMDRIYNEKYDDSMWPCMEGKRVIFAPSMVWKYSTFIYTWKEVLAIAKSRSDIVWIFRPHPMLGHSLVNTGKLKSIDEYEDYVKQWRSLTNADVQIGGDYIATFKSSDAMIADGTSFLTNYQYVGKPFLFLRGNNTEPLSEYGKELYETLYICDGNYYDEINDFLDKVVVNQCDYLKEKRENFFYENLNYHEWNNMSASEYIYHDILSSLT